MNAEPDCQHRILQMVPAQAGYAVATWIGDLDHYCEIEFGPEEIEAEPVTLWLLVQHDVSDGTFQTIEPWSAAGYVVLHDPEDWFTPEDLDCNTNNMAASEDPAHTSMRVYGLVEDVRARLTGLQPDWHPQMHESECP